MSRLIDADALKELFSEVIGHIAQKPEMNGNLEHMIRASAMVIQMIDDAPTVQPNTTTHDSIPAETGKKDGDGTSGDCISRQVAIDALNHMRSEDFDGLIVNRQKVESMLKALPSIQPERKTGRWITDDSELGIKCNKCGKSFSDYVNAGTEYVFLMETPKFCPNCEADMRGDKDG